VLASARRRKSFFMKDLPQVSINPLGHDGKAFYCGGDRSSSEARCSRLRPALPFARRPTDFG